MAHNFASGWRVLLVTLLATLMPLTASADVAGCFTKAEAAVASCCHEPTPGDRSPEQDTSDQGCPALCFAACCHASALPVSPDLSVRLVRLARTDVIQWATPERVPADLLLPPPRA